ncbi:type I secretion system permease/ATPase [Prosthecochloris sp. CIB 2401]|uniref:type I secretion system permease/ATPase n=1 Tax=Prosthecochloris sp. CIB 2401 TaxID=1868325 RepID=UPI00080AA5AE|nr:type I secretion system permease/ATPase [Prosthecochloris sp. CIB 2401]ANT64117.1 Type I secretion system ATP-binding protein PrsD [Prosthecochloris sp. CIB 2401]
MSHPQQKPQAKELFTPLLPYVLRVLFISVFTSILVLSPSLYMLEVYDRVVNSRSVSTLAMLTILVVGLYLILEMLEWVRSRHMHEGTLELDKALRPRVFHAVFAARLQGSPVGSVQPLNDLKTIRDVLPSTPLLSVLDVPLALLILVLLFLISPLLGWFAVGGALVQAAIGWFNERKTHEPFKEANRNAMRARQYADGVVKNAQVIEAMAMLPGIHKRWHGMQEEFLHQQAVASDYAGTSAALSKMVQMVVSSMLLGLGGLLALEGYIGGSLMIVGSILGGRVLAPLVQVITGWRQIESGREAYARLKGALEAFPLPDKGMPLPAPKGTLAVEGIVAGPPGTGMQVLKGVSFSLAEGGSVAIVGPSAAGKTTLARLLVGIWPALQGKVRLDGIDIYAWDKEELGPYIGYLPQDVELFEGTIAENVARFGDLDMAKVSEACRMVGLEGFIETLEAGYDTQIGTDGAFLSGGQRQRVGLARAIYGYPRLIVLDEPDASLDDDGDAALLEVIRRLREEQCTVVVITQRKNLVAELDHMLILVNGQVQKFGPRDEVLAELQPKPKPKPASAVVSIPTNGGGA